MKIRFAALLALSVGLSLLAPFASAQEAFPSKRITLVVPFPAGSATDNTARRIGHELAKATNQAVIVDNKPGADGNIAAMQAVRSDPDGHTVFITTNSTQAANINLFKSLPFDPYKDFAPVTGLVTIPILLVVRADHPAKTIAEYMAHAKSAAKPVTFGTNSQTGRGAGELFKELSKLNLLNVPYKGSPQALTDLLGGHVESLFVDPVSAHGMLQKGDVRALAATSAKRAATLPNVPTLAESGFPGFELTAWVAAYVPAKTPPAAIAKLNQLLTTILKDPATAEYLASNGATPFPTTPEQLAAHSETDTKRWAQVVQAAKMEKQ